MTNKKLIDSFIRINQAGEFAASKIYEGQIASINDNDTKRVIIDMAAHEQKHLEYFNGEIRARKIRPTLLTPIVSKTAYALGYITGSLGKDTAMLCTEAVEDAIVEHYDEQISILDDSESELRDNIQKFKNEELEHKYIAENLNSDYLSKTNRVIYKIINKGCKVAIKLVKYL